MKKLSTFLLAAIMLAAVLFLLPTTAQADVVDSGTCGDNLTWSLTDDGTLTISGTGAMYDWNYDEKPWYDNCELVTAVVIEDGVTATGKYAFSHCPNLTSVTIGSSVATLGPNTFSSCENLTSIVIPGTVNCIGESAFGWCKNLTDVTIQEGVTIIETQAFYYCDNLKNITVPNSVVYIGQWALSFNEDLNCNTYGNGLYIGNTSNPYAVMLEVNSTDITSCEVHPDTRIICCSFTGCKQLTDITIGDNIAYIDVWAFLHVEENLNYTIYDGAKYLGNSENPYAVLMDIESIRITSCKIHPGTRLIHSCGFSFCHMNTVIIPDSVRAVGLDGFNACSQLSNVYYTGSQEQWEKILFLSGNEDLLDASITYNYIMEEDPVDPPPAEPNYLTYKIDNGGAVITGIDGSFSGELVISETLDGYPVVAIDEWAFSNNTKLTGVTIPDSVVEIDHYAFWGCKELLSVTIGNGVTTIRSQVFQSCEKLATIDLGNSVRSIAYGAFSDCYALTEILLPDSLCSMEYGVFQSCTNLTAIRVSANNAYFCTDSKGVLFNKEQTLLIAAPGALSGSYTVPSSATSLMRYAFSGCESLTEIILPDNMTQIAGDAFRGCTRLTNINIPKAVTSIGGMAFLDCSSLESITIPASVTEIGRSAFLYCDALKDVYITDPSAWCNVSFDFWDANPMHCAQYLHILDENGNEITDVVLNSNVTVIPDSAFRNSKITSITLPDTITKISSYAFNSCTALTDVYFNGTAEQWSQIDIAYYNDPLTNAQIHFVGADGWIAMGDLWYYYQNGSAVTGWKLIGGSYYYFNAQGIMQTGWLQSGKTWYYLKSSGAMATSWLQVGGTWYYFNTSGAMVTGWLQVGGTWYYFNTSGAMVTGWLQVGGIWYYFNTSGAMVTGWLQVGGTWYYFNTSGAMVTGWLQVGGTWYYFNTSGAMVTGWLRLGNTWYYFNTSGAMVTGSLKIGAKVYNFASSGACLNP